MNHVRSLILGTIFLALRLPGNAGAQDRAVIPELDSLLFSRTVQALRDSAKGSDFRVVVAPLNSSTAIVYPGARDYLSPTPQISRARTQVLHQRGIATAPDVRFGRCLGAMIPILAGQSNNCPARSVWLLALALPRRGDVHFPPVRNDVPVTAHNARTTVRVARTVLSSGGAVATAIDAVFERRNGRWHLMRIVELQYVE